MSSFNKLSGKTTIWKQKLYWVTLVLYGLMPYLIYWLGGGEFVRGGALAVTTLISFVVMTSVSMMFYADLDNH